MRKIFLSGRRGVDEVVGVYDCERNAFFAFENIASVSHGIVFFGINEQETEKVIARYGIHTSRYYDENAKQYICDVLKRGSAVIVYCACGRYFLTRKEADLWIEKEKHRTIKVYTITCKRYFETREKVSEALQTREYLQEKYNFVVEDEL